MADNFGLKIGVEGEKEFKKALADINSQFKVLGSEMKLATSQFESNERSVESLTSKNEVLTKQIDAQKEKIETLRKALENVSDSFGGTDKRTQSWQIQLSHAMFLLYPYRAETAMSLLTTTGTKTQTSHTPVLSQRLKLFRDGGRCKACD